MTSAAVTDRCPRCSTHLVSARSAPPWCPACDWNLDLFDPVRDTTLGLRWADRRAKRLAHRLTRGQFAALAGQPIGKPGISGARLGTVVAAVVLYAFILALLLAGVWLVVRDFPTPTIVVGVPLVLLAILLRPRFGKLDRDTTAITRDA